MYSSNKTQHCAFLKYIQAIRPENETKMLTAAQAFIMVRVLSEERAEQSQRFLGHSSFHRNLLKTLALLRTIINVRADEHILLSFLS